MCDHLFKILMVGDARVGKTSLLALFAERTHLTSGFDFYYRSIDLHGKAVELRLWDTAHQTCFRSIMPSYYHGVDGIMLCFDFTCRSSFESCSDWLKEINRHASVDVDQLLVGMKCDCDVNEWEVSSHDVQDFAEANRLLSIETSSNDNTHVDDTFAMLAEAILARFDPHYIIFTLVSVLPSDASLIVSLTNLDGENVDISLKDSKPTVKVAIQAICQARKVSCNAVRLVTLDGTILNESHILPGAAAARKSCEIQ